jgi:hypothetical protein
MPPPRHVAREITAALYSNLPQTSEKQAFSLLLKKEVFEGSPRRPVIIESGASGGQGGVWPADAPASILARN